MADGDGEDDLFPIAVLIDELKTDDTQVRGASRAPAAERAGPFRMRGSRAAARHRAHQTEPRHAAGP
jgi:hypothetical protein